MTDRIFSKQDFVPDNNHADTAASACLSDAQQRAFAHSGEKIIAANCLEAKLGLADQIAKPLYSLNRLERLIAQETIRAIGKGDVRGVQESLQTLVENPKMQHSVMTGLTNYMVASFPRTHVTWESGKDKDGTPFMHLQLERADNDSKSSSYTSVEIGSDGTETAYHTAQGNIFAGKAINAKDALCTMKFDKKNEYLPKLKIY